jgi:hypothetical protein
MGNNHFNNPDLNISNMAVNQAAQTYNVNETKQNKSIFENLKPVDKDQNKEESK